MHTMTTPSRHLRLPHLRLLAALLAPTTAAIASDSAPKWEPLFNGRDLAGWVAPSPNLHWRVEAGVLVGQSDPAQGGSMLWTEKPYGDFLWEGEVRWSPQADTGVMFRTPALQVQIGTSISLKRDLTGSFYISRGGGYVEPGQAKDAEKHLKPGEWNTLRLRARGDTFTVWINGVQVAEYTDSRFAEAGPIGLQVHQKLDMRAEFRNIRIQTLP